MLDGKIGLQWKGEKCPSRSLTIINNQEGIPVNEVPQQDIINNILTNNNTQLNISQEPALNHHEVSDVEGEAPKENEVPNGDWALSDNLLRMSNESEPTLSLQVATVASVT